MSNNDRNPREDSKRAWYANRADSLWEELLYAQQCNHKSAIRELRALIFMAEKKAGK